VTQEIRCVAPHPDFPGSQCRKRLAVVEGPPVTVSVGIESGPGCIVVPCPRCGAENVVCPAHQAAA
jgi:hypothetical protein